MILGVLNKNDLGKVDPEKVKQFEEKEEAKIIDISCKTGDNIDKVMKKVGAHLIAAIDINFWFLGETWRGPRIYSA